MVREGRVLIPGTSAADANLGSGYLVTAYEVGAQVALASSGTTINVRPGHGFQAGDLFIVGLDTDRYRDIFSVTSTTIETNSAVYVAQGEFLINLGADSGLDGPNYDGSGAPIYQDMAFLNAYVNSTVTADSVGRYRYFHKGIARWELVRSSTGTPVAYYLDTDNPADEDRTSYQVRYAHLFSTGGAGTAADPWVTSGSNPVQAAINDIIANDGTTLGGTVRCVAGVYDLGNATEAVVIGSSTENLEGWTIEGYGPGTTSDNATDGGTIFLYSGSGAAFALGDFTSNNKTLGFCTMKNFKVMQNASDGVGTGFKCRLYRHGVFEDILCEDFAYGATLSTISDFNTFRRFRTRDCRSAGVYVGYTTGMLTPNGQCNANLFHECDIMNLARLAGYTNYGIFIDADSVNNVIYGNSRFHNHDTAASAAIICRHSNGLTVDGCYFEGNYHAVWIQNAGTSDFYGYTVSNNYITQTPLGTAILTNSGSSGLLSGVVISRNHITNPSVSSPYNVATGVVIHNNVRNAVLVGNEYVSLNTADVTVGGASATYVRIEEGTTLTTGGATVGGTLTLTTGVVTTAELAVSGNITSGGHLQGLKETFNLSSNDVIPHGGRFMVDITNVTGTNTFTVAAPSSDDGKIFILRCAALTAGTMTLADSGNVSLSAAWVPDAGDTLTLVASGVVWYELARSAN